MTPRNDRRSGRDRASGQMIVIFTLCLVAIISMAALLVDGGLGWSNRREAQAAADTAALAAAHDVVANRSVKGEAAARGIAAANKFATDLVNCAGTTVPNAGVVVNRPPLQGAHTTTTDPLHANDFVEVVTSRAMHTTFAAAVGQGCWMVSARAVASIGSSSVASCSFCSLNNTKNNHTILLQNGARLRVDGDIYTNSFSGCTSTTTTGGLTSCNDGATCVMKSSQACGDGFDVFGTPPTPPAYISAKTISVVGGWETHDDNIVLADSRLAPPTRTTCPVAPTPPDQLLADPRASNVCVHMPPIVDPFGAVTAPVVGSYTVPTATSCTADSTSINGVKAGSSTVVTTISTGSWTICPGRYFGLLVTGATTKVVMASGVYFMTNKGFIVKDGGSIDGSSGVMIYNAQSASNGIVQISQIEEGANIPAEPDLVTANAWDTYPTATIPVLTFTNGANRTAPVTPTYTFKAAQVGTAKMTGELHFFDGGTQLDSVGDANCPTKVQVAAVNSFQGTCKVAWTTADVGTHGLAGVFVSTVPAYRSYEKIQDPREVIKSTGIVGGNTALKPMTTGLYAGFVIWQDRNSALNLILSPASNLPACTGTWLTAGIPNSSPPPCGSMGGISGTIYSGNTTSQVQITASGLADLQIIAGRILVTNGVDARFAFNPGVFALGGIRLIE